MKANAFYYRENYYLLPKEYPKFSDFIAFLTEFPKKIITVKRLICNYYMESKAEKGICIPPYFYSEYGFPDDKIVIYDITDVFPVSVFLLTQEEYNSKLRKVVLDYCPGCRNYTALTKSEESLNGHFGEITLDSVCFFRRETRTYPRAMAYAFYVFGNAAERFPLKNLTSEELLEKIEFYTRLKLKSGEFNEDKTAFTISYKPDFLTQTILRSLDEYMEKHFPYDAVRLISETETEYTDEQIKDLIENTDKEKMRRICKRHGIAFGVLTADEKYFSKVESSLIPLVFNDEARILGKDGKTFYLMIFDKCYFLKSLHFRSPLMKAANSKITVFDQENVTEYALTFDMKKTVLNDN